MARVQHAISVPSPHEAEPPVRCELHQDVHTVQPSQSAVPVDLREQIVREVLSAIAEKAGKQLQEAKALPSTQPHNHRSEDGIGAAISMFLSRLLLFALVALVVVILLRLCLRKCHQLLNEETGRGGRHYPRRR